MTLGQSTSLSCKMLKLRQNNVYPQLLYCIDHLFSALIVENHIRVWQA